MKKENIYNIPNAITSIRILISAFILYAIFAGFGLKTITYAFIIGMLTDFFDGQIARRYNLITEFGRRFDILADRLLMLVTILALLNIFIDNGHTSQLIQLAMITSRELITIPFALYAFAFKNFVPNVRQIGKLTTLLQAIALPLIILSIYSNAFNFSIYFAVITCVVGLVSGIYYIKDLTSSK